MSVCLSAETTDSNDDDSLSAAVTWTEQIDSPQQHQKQQI